MSDFDPINAARNIGRAALGPLGEFAPGMGGKADPLKLFDTDSMTKGGGKASGKGGAPALPGNGDGINELLSKLGGLDDKHRIAGAESASDVSSSMGKDGGNASAAGADGGGAGAGGGAQAIIGQIMGIIKQLLPMIMGMLGGL